MQQTITNIPRCLPEILTVQKFWYHLTHLFSRKNVPFDFERAFWEAEAWERRLNLEAGNYLQVLTCKENFTK